MHHKLDVLVLLNWIQYRLYSLILLDLEYGLLDLRLLLDLSIRYIHMCLNDNLS